MSLDLRAAHHAIESSLKRLESARASIERAVINLQRDKEALDRSRLLLADERKSEWTWAPNGAQGKVLPTAS